MPKFEVEVVRQGYSKCTVTVEAETEKQARNLACDEAANRDLREYDAEYFVDDIRKK